MLQAGTWSIRMMIAGGVVCLWAVETTQPAAAGEAPAVRSIGHESQLLVDDVLLVRKTGVLRKVHSCEKLPQPVLASEEPWEQDGPDQRVYVYGTVLRDGPTGPFRMWYNRNSLVLYATSSDGLSWKRPRLGLCEYKGSKQNNIVFQLFHSPSVVYNPRPEDPDHRYNMLGYGRVSRPGYYTAHSADGLHWDLYTATTTRTAGTCRTRRSPLPWPSGGWTVWCRSGRARLAAWSRRCRCAVRGIAWWSTPMPRPAS